MVIQAVRLWPFCVVTKVGHYIEPVSSSGAMILSLKHKGDPGSWLLIKFSYLSGWKSKQQGHELCALSVDLLHLMENLLVSVFSAFLPLPAELYAFSKRSVFPWIYYFRAGTNPLFLSNLNPCLNILRNIIYFGYGYVIFVFTRYFIFVFQLYPFYFLRPCNRLCLPPGSWPGQSPIAPLTAWCLNAFQGEKNRRAENSFYPITLWQFCTLMVQKGEDGGFSASCRWARVKPEPSLCLFVTQSYLMNNWGYCWTWQHAARGQNFLILCEHLSFGISGGKNQVSFQTIDANKKKKRKHETAD